MKSAQTPAVLAAGGSTPRAAPDALRAGLRPVRAEVGPGSGWDCVPCAAARAANLRCAPLSLYPAFEASAFRAKQKSRYSRSQAASREPLRPGAHQSSPVMVDERDALSLVLEPGEVMPAAVLALCPADWYRLRTHRDRPREGASSNRRRCLWREPSVRADVVLGDLVIDADRNVDACAVRAYSQPLRLAACGHRGGTLWREPSACADVVLRDAIAGSVTDVDVRAIRTHGQPLGIAGGHGGGALRRESTSGADVVLGHTASGVRNVDAPTVRTHGHADRGFTGGEIGRALGRKLAARTDVELGHGIAGDVGHVHTPAVRAHGHAERTLVGGDHCRVLRRQSAARADAV